MYRCTSRRFNYNKHYGGKVSPMKCRRSPSLCMYPAKEVLNLHNVGEDLPHSAASCEGVATGNNSSNTAYWKGIHFILIPDNFSKSMFRNIPRYYLIN